MTGQSISVVQIVETFDDAVVFVVQQVDRHHLDQPQVSILPWLAPPDDTHREPWSAFRAQVVGVSEPETVVAPLPASWPPPAGKAVQL